VLPQRFSLLKSPRSIRLTNQSVYRGPGAMRRIKQRLGLTVLAMFALIGLSQIVLETDTDARVGPTLGS